MKNSLIKNISTVIFEIRKYAFLNSSKKVWAEISSLVFWNSKVLFYNYLKQGMKEKHCSKYFQIAKYTFLNFWKRVWAKTMSQVFSDSLVSFFEYLKKGMSKKILLGIVQIRSCAFSNIWKSNKSNKILPVIFRLVSVLF